MTDQRLRELERAARLGDREAQDDFVRELVRIGTPPVDLLRRRLEVGHVHRDRVELAAYMEDPTAEQVLGRASRHAHWRGDLREWARGLKRWGKQVRIRAAVAAVRLALPNWEGRAPRLREAVAGAEAWIDCPCDAHTTAARHLATRCRRARRDYAGERTARLGIVLVAGEALLEATAMGRSGVGRASEAILNAAVTFSDERYFQEFEPPDHRLGRWMAIRGFRAYVAYPGFQLRIRIAIREALLPWVLEGADPLADPLS